MKKIILLNHTANAILGFRKHLILFLISKGYTVYCLAGDFTPELNNKVEKLGAIPVSYNLQRTGLNPLQDIRNFLHLKDTISDIAPDIILSSFAKPVIYGTLAAKLAKVPKIGAMIEGLGFYFTEQEAKPSFKTKLIKSIQIFLYKLSLPKADIVFFLNNDDPKDLLERYNINVKKYAVINGIGLDLDEYPYSIPPSNPVSFLFIARLLKEKGIYEYLQAATNIKKKYPEILFNVVGGLDEGNPGGLTQQQLQQYIDNKLINYPGYTNDIQGWINKSSVFVLPSYYREGLPRSTQEAMAMGRPIITTNVTGCKETVEDNINGFLIPKWNSNALAEKMEFFINNPDKITAMGLSSRNIAESKFNGNIINQQIISFLE